MKTHNLLTWHSYKKMQVAGNACTSPNRTMALSTLSTCLFHKILTQYVLFAFALVTMSFFYESG